MLIRKINEYIQDNKFKKAYKRLRKYVRNGDYFSSGNRELKGDLRDFNAKYKGYYKGATKAQIKQMATSLQRLTVTAEKQRVKTPWNLFQKLTAFATVLFFVLELIVPTMFNYYKETPKFEEANKTKVLVYDFVNFTSQNDYAIDDLICNAINNPKSRIWAKNFEAKRYRGSTKHDLHHLNFSLSGLSEVVDNGIRNVAKRFGKYRADRAITGWLLEKEKKDGKVYILEIKTISAGSEAKVESVSIELDEIKNLFTSTCKQAILLRMLNVDKLSSNEGTLKDINEFLKECHPKMNEEELKKFTLKSTNIALQIKGEVEVNLPDVIQNLCDTYHHINDSIGERRIDISILCGTNDPENPDPIDTLVESNKLDEIYKQMSVLLTGIDRKVLSLSLKEDVICLTAFYPKNKASLPEYYNYTLKRISDFANSNALFFEGEGHACELGVPYFDNNKLSSRRIRKLLERIPLTNEGRIKGYGTTVPLDSKQLAMNRRATIKFFLEQENEADLATAKK